ncbi:HlyD family efflux transporter periplasmic adaptor subunit [Aliikangiella maris]|uniref:HlyD family efflux transporter periplasmic adaptor subunit n=2 Tax=Aliikangiella maris TaxID=3162458 RepID=A0ABV3MN26_9GAMM
MEDYLLKSSTQGTVTNIQYKIGQTLRQNTPVMVILPASAEYQAELFVPSRSIGFIELNKKVLIRYDAFPYQRFGIYSGAVANIGKTILLPSEVSTPVNQTEAFYKVKVKLDKQFVTAYAKELNLQSGMLLDAAIILENRSFIEWLLEPIFSLKGHL